MSEKVSVYYLELHHPSEGKQKIRLGGETSIGSAASNTISIDESDLAPKHCVLRVHQEVLTIFQIAESGTSKIGRQALDNGRMYILEKGDKLTLADIKAVIRVEKEVVQEIEEDDDEEFEDDKTADDIQIPSDEELDDEDEEDDEEIKPSFFARFKAKFTRSKKDEQEDLEADEEIEQLEEDEQDEEEEKTDEIKNSIYIPKAKVDEEDEVEVKKPKKKVKKPVNRDDMPAFFARLYGFVAEIVISFAFISNVIPILDLNAVFNQSTNDVIPLIQKVVDLLTPYVGEHANLLAPLTSFTFVSVFITWIAINIVSNIILGSNLGLALLSVRTEGSFVTSRIKAVARFVIGLILLPFVIFDLPALIKKRTLKEVITASELSYRHFLLKYLGILVVLPAFTVAVVILPALTDPSIMEGPQVTRSLVVKEAKEDIALQTHPLRSIKLALSFPQDFTAEWAFSPVLRLSKGKLSASVNFIRQRGETTDIVTIGPINKLQPPVQLFKAISKIDPFFDNKYPQLSAALISDGLIQASDSDVVALMLDTLEISWETLPKFLSERGPTLTPYLNLKKYLITEFALLSNASVNASLLGRKTILELSSSPNNLKLVTSVDGDLVSINLSTRPGKQVGLVKFKRTFLHHAAPLMSDATAPTYNSSYWSFLDFLDHFNNSKIEPFQAGAQALTDFTNRYLSERANKAWSIETIERDYARTMKTLQSLSQQPNGDWAKPYFDAMNVDQGLWQREETPEQVSPDDQQVPPEATEQE